jgi:hypothetical protein
VASRFALWFWDSQNLRTAVTWRLGWKYHGSGKLLFFDRNGTAKLPELANQCDYLSFRNLCNQNATVFHARKPRLSLRQMSRHMRL